MTEIRSYRRVFDLERRIYRIDRLRLNPGGVPVRGVLYFLATLVLDLIAGRLPLLGIALGAFPWYLRDVALPGAIATVLSMIRMDGRPFHVAAHALLRHWLSSNGSLAGAARETPSGARWYPEPIVILPDGSDGRLRRFRYTGPGAVLITVGHERAGRALEQGATGWRRGRRGPALILRGREGEAPLSTGQVIALAAGAQMRVDSSHGTRQESVKQRW